MNPSSRKSASRSSVAEPVSGSSPGQAEENPSQGSDSVVSGHRSGLESGSEAMAFKSAAANQPAAANLPSRNTPEDGAITIDRLCDKLAKHLPETQLNCVYQAYYHAERAHAGQTRRSGEAYITHPLAVANIVADMNLDYRSVMSALLHDVLEDTNTDRGQMAAEFGEEVAKIVDGLSKLNHLEFKTKEDAQAESLRKMMLAMVSDIRVIMIKLADRLHNMRTLGAMSVEKRKRISQETQEVYAPIAHRLGMYSIKNELEDLAFGYLYPWRSRVLQKRVQLDADARRGVIARIESNLSSRLAAADINAEVRGRRKHLYSLFRKMQTKQLTFEEVYDIRALRVVVDSVDSCYRALGVCHDAYKPYPGRFKDYIAVPKDNGYQSLHTVLSYTQGVLVEIQIRTREMDEFAEYGIAAHWAYKDGDSGEQQNQAYQWLSSLLDMQDNSSDVHEFIENVKFDLYPGEIYVFTPKGRIIQLPTNATPVDFAYAVHSQVGAQCVSCEIDGKVSSLSTPLETGQTVKIHTLSSARPSPMWLNYVVTAKARSAIRHYLRRVNQQKAAEFGERLLERALTRYDMLLDSFSEREIQQLLSEYGYENAQALYVSLGLGNHLPSVIANQLVQKHNANAEENQTLVREASPLLIEGREGTVLQLSKCCRPIPGDNVQGFITSGKGIAVHRASCRRVQRSRRKAKEWVAVNWATEIDGEFDVLIVVDLKNQTGALARVTTVLSSLEANIEGVDFHKRGENNIVIHFVIRVRDRQHLARIIRRVRNLAAVLSIKRG